MRVRPLRRSLLFTAVATFLGAAAGFFVATDARADDPGTGVEQESREYYSDAAMTQHVGGWWYDCNGNVRSWGVQTIYMTSYRSACY
ncbi:hypothetical protein DRW03_16440 [Corallococcus sp. H22C18031201]|uniref:DUF6289 family protein n=1 Tax=Citreicoccus inhibens TaxID=2849499 RepID=UPI000E70CCCB|nr:DUF6289 family protein [Citreicoccus inhibens]MBU8896789.1 DUF4859 domain-containing protein [Citreicoccus inhibens]RJS21915.1 hypothetical protein DRW03_16440 [Corallococcus sp. H22C18031201]